MTDVPDAVLDAFVAASREAARRRLLRCSSGNLSLRLDGERMLVTASRAWMGGLTREQVVLCRIADASVLAGPRPSVETRFHAAILRHRSDRSVVLHFQSPAATALACTDLAGVDFNVLPEIPYYIGPIGIVAYLPPGSEQLAEAVTAAMQQHDLAMLRNHGQVVVGTDLNDAIEKAEFFELACDILLRAGPRAVTLDAEAVAALRDKARGC
ncbi:class II aldolase/adducin family protein [bacterium]|nr:class II aldolase/adducin family protein [bacterium]